TVILKKMTKKRKPVRKYSSKKHSKYSDKEKSVSQVGSAELSNIEKNMNMTLSEDWRLMATPEITYDLKNPKPGFSLLKDLSSERKPIEFFFSLMSNDMIDH